MVEEAVAAIGRDDIGVNVADEGGGMLAVTFSRGSREHIAHVPAAELEDRERGHIAVNTALLAFSKRIAQDALTKGRGRGRTERPLRLDQIFPNRIPDEHGAVVKIGVLHDVCPVRLDGFHADV